MVLIVWLFVGGELPALMESIQRQQCQVLMDMDQFTPAALLMRQVCACVCPCPTLARVCAAESVAARSPRVAACRPALQRAVPRCNRPRRI